VARRFIVYREARARGRAERRVRLREPDGRESVLDRAVLRSAIAEAAVGLGPAVDVEAVYREMLGSLYDGITRDEIAKSAVLAARARMEREPEYTYLAARLLLVRVYAEALDTSVALHEMERIYGARFERY